jgi:hypothetical protein
MSAARELTLSLYGKWYGNHGSAPCPVCQPDRRKDQHGLSVKAEAGRLLIWCHKTGCDFRDVLDAAGIARDAPNLAPVVAPQAEAQRAAYDAAKREQARRIWGHAGPICGTKGEAYLRGRGITCPLPPSLRWSVDLFHGPSGRYLSAMVASVSTGGVHRTFFENAGGRIEGNAKMMLGPCAGGAVALSEAQGALVACEGIETGLSLLSGLLDAPTSVWAALSTSGVRALDLPPTPGRLILAPDGDAPGMAAAEVLGNRAYALGWQVYMMAPPEGKDWNDVLQSGVAA